MELMDAGKSSVKVLHTGAEHELAEFSDFNRSPPTFLSNRIRLIKSLPDNVSVRIRWVVLKDVYFGGRVVLDLAPVLETLHDIVP